MIIEAVSNKIFVYINIQSSTQSRYIFIYLTQYRSRYIFYLSNMHDKSKPGK